MVDLARWSQIGGGASTFATVPEITSDASVPRVLVIDDDTEIHQLLSARLQARGYDVSVASSGEEGLNRIRDVAPDLIFLDVAMSGMTGIDVYSDGLTLARPDLFRDHETMAAQIADEEPAGVTAQRLVELATSAGPLPDDLTVVALRRRRAH